MKLRIDAHNHFWKYDPVRDSWITDDLSIIQNDFFSEDFLPDLKANNIDGTVAVQADQSLEETYFLLDLANKNEWLKGVVGWMELQSNDIEA